MTPAAAPGEQLELAAHGIGDGAVEAIRAESEQAALVEHRVAVLTGLVERFGTRYLERASEELLSAVEALSAAGERRAAAVGSLASTLGLRREATLGEIVDAAPEPVSSTLAALRAELNAARRRIAAHSEQNTDLLGRRMALVAEAIAGYPDGIPPVYGRAPQAPPRFVRGLL